MLSNSSSDINQQEQSENRIYIKCKQCDSLHCRQCFKQHIVSQHGTETLSPNFSQYSHSAVLCQECQEDVSAKYCENCEQNLCQKCAFRIHNKGKRAKHVLHANTQLINFKAIKFMGKEEELAPALLEGKANTIFIRQTNKQADEIDQSIKLILQESRNIVLSVELSEAINITQIQTWLNKYPMIDSFDISGSLVEKALKEEILSRSLYSDEQACKMFYLNGFRVAVIGGEDSEPQNEQASEIKNKAESQKGTNQEIAKDASRSESAPVASSQQNQEVEDFILQTQLRLSIPGCHEIGTSPPELSPQKRNSKFKKKDSVDLSYEQKQRSSCFGAGSGSIGEKPFKKSLLKSSNRSLIIEIPQGKPYKESPIKSDREQGFMQRCNTFTQKAKTNRTDERDNEYPNQNADKTTTINLDYNDYSASHSTTFNNILEQSDNDNSNSKSSIQKSILLAGSLNLLTATNSHNSYHHNNSSSFRTMNNQQSYDDSTQGRDIQQSRVQVSLNGGNMSTSTDNNSMKRKHGNGGNGGGTKQQPIPYLQVYKSLQSQSGKNDNQQHNLSRSGGSSCGSGSYHSNSHHHNHIRNHYQNSQPKNLSSLQKQQIRTQKKLRSLCQQGTLMITPERMQQLNIKFDEKILRKVKKTVCEKQLEYFALSIDSLSVEVLFWVLQSIKQDRMMPSEKLVLSRLKESFNIKPANRLWMGILKYLQSSRYTADRQQHDKNRKKYRAEEQEKGSTQYSCFPNPKALPLIYVSRPANLDQCLLQYEQKWQYQDQTQAVPNPVQWQQFTLVLNNYFKHSKQITGGRYGCVQYVKMNGPECLKKCSLGRLSFYVQQAINKGLIRYHKTLLVQNQHQQKGQQGNGANQGLNGTSTGKSQNCNKNGNYSQQQHQYPYQNQQNGGSIGSSFLTGDASSSVRGGAKYGSCYNNNKLNNHDSSHTRLSELQHQLKVLIVQSTLIDILLQAGCQTQISLAQIPLTFKKTILFQVNLLELGFPKLKNLLQTVTDKLVLSSSKSHVKYMSVNNSKAIEELRHSLQQISSCFVTDIAAVIYQLLITRHNMLAQELQYLTNERLGFEFDFRVCQVSDFHQFLIYYCHQTINMQFINGVFVAFPRCANGGSYGGYGSGMMGGGGMGYGQPYGGGMMGQGQYGGNRPFSPSHQQQHGMIPHHQLMYSPPLYGASNYMMNPQNSEYYYGAQFSPNAGYNPNNSYYQPQSSSATNPIRSPPKIGSPKESSSGSSSMYSRGVNSPKNYYNKSNGENQPISPPHYHQPQPQIFQPPMGSPHGNNGYNGTGLMPSQQGGNPFAGSPYFQPPQYPYMGSPSSSNNNNYSQTTVPQSHPNYFPSTAKLQKQAQQLRGSNGSCTGNKASNNSKDPGLLRTSTGSSASKPQSQQTLSPPPLVSQISTPKFNQSIQYINKNSKHNQKNLSSMKWQSYLQLGDENDDHVGNGGNNNNNPKFNHHEQQSQSYSDYQSIYKILDQNDQQDPDGDSQNNKSKASYPNTVIQKNGSCNNQNFSPYNELYISKITPIDEKLSSDHDCSQGLGFFDQEQGENDNSNCNEENQCGKNMNSSPNHAKDSNKVVLLNKKYGNGDKKKGDHNRVYSTTEQRTKHQRVYSTTTAKN